MSAKKASKVKIKPIGGNILVKPVEEETKTESGIVLPETVDKEKPQKGEVVALGTGRLSEDGDKIPFNVKVGDIIIFKKYGPDEINIDDQEYLIMEESDVLGVMA
jgi:chaperonin GroES